MFSFDYVKDFDPEVAKAMEDELGRQRNNLELIASENLVSEAVMAAMGSHLFRFVRKIIAGESEENKMAEKAG